MGYYKDGDRSIMETVICDVCEREIPFATAVKVPAIGFMCPPDVLVKYKCESNIWESVRILQARQRAHDVERIAELIETHPTSATTAAFAIYDYLNERK